jgi:hypothetical protein
MDAAPEMKKARDEPRLMEEEEKKETVAQRVKAGASKTKVLVRGVITRCLSRSCSAWIGGL